MSRTHSIALVCLLSAVSAALSGCSSLAARSGNNKGIAYFEQGDYQSAMAEFRRAVADSPERADYVSNYATSLKKVGRVDQSRQSYKHALRLDPAHQPSYHGLASLYMETGQPELAMSLLQGWVETQPYNPKSHVEMAWLQREMGNYAAAEQSLHTALQINPNHPVAQAQLGQIYQDTGRAQEALAMYQSSLVSDWNQPQVHDRVAQMNPNPAFRDQHPQTAYTARPALTQRVASAPPAMTRQASAHTVVSQGPVLSPPATQPAASQIQQVQALIPADPSVAAEVVEKPPVVNAH